MRVRGIARSIVRTATVGLLGAASLLGAPAARAQPSATAPRERPVVLVSTLRFEGRSANSIEPGDSAVALTTTARLVAALRAADVATLVDSARAATAIAQADTAGQRCAASLDCLRDVGRRLGARYVVLGKVSKVSGLIWYLSAQLAPVDGGPSALDEGFELKGGRDDIVPRGGESLGRRIGRAIEGRGATSGG